MDIAVKPQGCTNLKLRQLMRRVAQLYDAEVARPACAARSIRCFRTW
jgi:hypothetical protein